MYNNKRRVNQALIETFSPAVRHTTVKAAVAVSVLLNRKRVGFDVTGAYLQGEYTEDEVVYARPPKGYRTLSDDGVPMVWRMRVPLYGQGDAGLVWFRTIKAQPTHRKATISTLRRRPQLLLQTGSPRIIPHLYVHTPFICTSEYLSEGG